MKFYFLLKRSPNLGCMKILKAIIIFIVFILGNILVMIDLGFLLISIFTIFRITANLNTGSRLSCWLFVIIFDILIIGIDNMQNLTGARCCEELSIAIFEYVNNKYTRDGFSSCSHWHDVAWELVPCEWRLQILIWFSLWQHACHQLLGYNI